MLVKACSRARRAAFASVCLLLPTVSAVAQERCEYPQTPRDITQSDGAAAGTFTLAPRASSLNLCNLHFHVNAEHRGPGYLLPAKVGDKRGGYICNTSDSLTEAERRPVNDVCGHGSHGVRPGDTIEVHWVYTSCPVATTPGKGLALCSPPACSKPVLRVESQVFLVVNNPAAVDLNQFDLAGSRRSGRLQAKALPARSGMPVQFLGSTTGPAYADKCSPAQVTWSVRPKCARLDISSLKHWCESNKYDEHHGHGVRPLVTNVYSLGRIVGD